MIKIAIRRAPVKTGTCGLRGVFSDGKAAEKTDLIFFCRLGAAKLPGGRLEGGYGVSVRPAR